MARVMAMTVVFLLAVVVKTSPAKATDCTSVISNVYPCMNFLRNPNTALPETKCCDAAKKLIADNLCDCFRPLGSAFLLSKAQQLPNLCNSNSFLPFVKCIALSLGDSGGLLPPLPLPPLPLVPPVANQEQQDNTVQSREVDFKPLLRTLPLAPHPLQPNIPFPPMAKNIMEEKKK